MKKTIAFSAFLCLFASLNAQIHKGSWLISGNASSSQLNLVPLNEDNKMLDSKANYSVINFGVGYFAHKRWLVGLGGIYENSKTLSVETGNNNLYASNTKLVSYMLKPYTRYYFTPNKKIKLYAEAKADMSIVDAEYSQYQSSLPIDTRDLPLRKGYRLGTALGFNYFLANNIAIDFKLPYDFYQKGEVVWRYTNGWSPYRFHTALSMNLFLNTDKKDSKVLADKYLQKGNIMVGIDGSSFFNSDYNRFIAKSNIGYFLTKHWLVGTEIDVFFANKWGDAGISPFIKYYQPIQKDIQLVAAAKTGGVLTYGEGKSNIYGNDLIMSIGINKFIAENISVEGLVNIPTGITENKKIGLNPFAAISINYFMSK